MTLWLLTSDGTVLPIYAERRSAARLRGLATTQVPREVAVAAGSDSSEVVLELNHHFRIQPGEAFSAAVGELPASLQYSF